MVTAARFGEVPHLQVRGRVLLATDGVLPGHACPGSTTEGAEGRGSGPKAREEGDSPGKGYQPTSAPRA